MSTDVIADYLRRKAMANDFEVSRSEFCQALRSLAGFLETHPDIPLPKNYGGIKFTAQVETVEELRKAFHLSGPWSKEYVGETANYHKKFGPQPEEEGTWARGNHIEYKLSLPREQVCVKRKVGEQWIPGYTPAYTQQGYYQPVYEWDCM